MKAKGEQTNRALISEFCMSNSQLYVNDDQALILTL